MTTCLCQISLAGWVELSKSLRLKICSNSYTPSAMPYVTITTDLTNLSGKAGVNLWHLYVFAWISQRSFSQISRNCIDTSPAMFVWLAALSLCIDSSCEHPQSEPAQKYKVMYLHTCFCISVNICKGTGLQTQRSADDLGYHGDLCRADLCRTTTLEKTSWVFALVFPPQSAPLHEQGRTLC